MKIGIVGARKYQERQSRIELVISLPAGATTTSSIGKMGIRNGFFSILSRFWRENRNFSWHGRGFFVKFAVNLEVGNEVLDLRDPNRFGRRRH